MTRCGLVLGMLLVGGTALAQAPGETPPAAAAPTSAPDPALANRWGIGLDLGGEGITPEAQPDGGATFTILQLAVRFRATHHLELALALAGGGAKTAPGMPDGAVLSSVALDLRYRFAPRSAWDGWIVGGIGGMEVAPPHATSQMQKGAERGMLSLGAGVERRFGSLALQAELRALAIGAAKASSTPLMSGSATAGQLTIGAAFYF